MRLALGAQSLATLQPALTAAGHQVELWPLFELIPNPDFSLPTTAVDDVVFVSPSAVAFAADLAHRARRVFAVGRSTALALLAAGVEVVHFPASGEGAQALAQTPLLAPAGASVRWVSAYSPPQWLVQKLEQGAVQWCQAYVRRWCPPPEQTVLGALDGFVVSTTAALEHLITVWELPPHVHLWARHQAICDQALHWGRPCQMLNTLWEESG